MRESHSSDEITKFSVSSWRLAMTGQMWHQRVDCSTLLLKQQKRHDLQSQIALLPVCICESLITACCGSWKWWMICIVLLSQIRRLKNKRVKIQRFGKRVMVRSTCCHIAWNSMTYWRVPILTTRFARVVRNSSSFGTGVCYILVIYLSQW